jgi:hypothetical protein
MEQPPPIENATPEALPAPEPMSLTGRLCNVFAAPGEVFDSIKARPASTANWLVPAILYTVLGIVGFWLAFSQPAIQQQVHEMTAKAMEKQFAKAKMSPEQAEQVRAQAEKWGGIAMKISVYFGVAVDGFAAPFLWGLFIWLAGTKGLKGQFSYLKAVEVAGLSKMIDVLGVVIGKLLAIVTSNYLATPSLVLLIKEFDPQNPMHLAAGLTDVVVLWMLAVRAVGLSKLANVSFGKAAAWVFGFWLAYSGLIIGGSLAAQAIGGR